MLVIDVGGIRYRKRRAHLAEGELPLAAAARSADRAEHAREAGMWEETRSDGEAIGSSDVEDDIEDLEAEGIVPEGRAGSRSDKWIARLHIPPEQFKFLVGKRGASKQGIERDTRTQIKIPSNRVIDAAIGIRLGKGAGRRHQPSLGSAVLLDVASKRRHGGHGGSGGAVGDLSVVVRGATGSAVRRAKTMLEVIAADTARRLDYTHFLCIPLRDAAPSVAKFQADVLSRFGPGSSTPAQGLEESVLVSPRQLHMTLLMLRIYTPEALRAAIGAIRSVAERVRHLLRSQRVSLQGIEHMNDDASETHVLYLQARDQLPPASGGGHSRGGGTGGQQARGGASTSSGSFGGGGTGAVREAFSVLYGALQEGGLVEEEEAERQRLRGADGRLSPKLHATVINTRLRRSGRGRGAGKGSGGGQSGGDSGSMAARLPVDARALLAHYNAEGGGGGTAPLGGGTCSMEQVCLCRRGPFAPDGFYRTEAVAGSGPGLEGGSSFALGKHASLPAAAMGLSGLGVDRGRGFKGVTSGGGGGSGRASAGASAPAPASGAGAGVSASSASASSGAAPAPVAAAAAVAHTGGAAARA